MTVQQVPAAEQQCRAYEAWAVWIGLVKSSFIRRCADSLMAAARMVARIMFRGKVERDCNLSPHEKHGRDQGEAQMFSPLRDDRIVAFSPVRRRS